MESFLKLVAADLYKHTEGNLAHTAVVFPNKRAGLFFNEYLAQESDSPIGRPHTSASANCSVAFLRGKWVIR